MQAHVPRRRSAAPVRIFGLDGKMPRLVHQAWLEPGQRDLPTALARGGVVLRLFPLEHPRDGLLISLEIRRDGCRLSGVRLKASGALGEVPLRLPLPEGLPPGDGTLRVRSNAALRLLF